MTRWCALRSAGLAVVLLGAGAGGSAPQHPVTDVYFGTPVVDPYRSMESDDPSSTAWRTAQVAATRAMLARARRDAGFDARASTSPTPARLSDLAVVRGHAFFLTYASSGGELHERDVHAGTDRTIITGRRFDAGAKHGSLGAFAVSNDARLIAIHVYIGDASDSDVHIVRIADGSDVEAPLAGTIFDYIGFTPDDRAIVYAKPAHPGRELAVPDVAYDYLHRIGTDGSTDVAIFGPGLSPLVDVPPHAFAFVDTGQANAVAEVRDVGAGGSRFFTAPLATLGTPQTPWRPLGSAADGYTDYAVHGTTIDLATSTDAPNYAVVRASLTGPFAPRIVLPASQTVVISGTLDFIPKAGIFALNASEDADYVQLLDHGIGRVTRIPYDDDARPQPVALPLDGTVLAIATSIHDRGAFVDLTTWSQPGDVYAFDPRTGAAAATGFVPAAAVAPRVAENLTATASDGTPIEVSVVHAPGMKLDGTHPLVLRVAGAYGFSLTPNFGAVPQAWLDRGGVYAVAHVRGGGERGEAWHHAGMGDLKRNTWTDLIAAANELIAAGYTSPDRLDLYGTTQSYLGGIASSIAIGRAIEERPDLFACAVVDAPVFDLLRSEGTHLGRQSVSEFGSVTSATGFAALLAMSPYEHVRTGVAYPPLLVRSFSRFGLGDDWEAAKMVARLQWASGRADAAWLDVPESFDGLRDDALAFFLACNRRSRPT